MGCFIAKRVSLGALSSVMIVSPIVNYPAEGVMFIDADLRAMIVARFELVGTEETPGVPETPAGLAAARSSALRELVRLIYDRAKFSPAAFAGERSSLALVVDAAEDHWQRMHAAALGFPAPPTGDPDASSP